MTRRLVLTADDLGMHPDANAAVVDLLTNGPLTATTLLTGAPAATDAVGRIRAASAPTPRLHAALTQAQRDAGVDVVEHELDEQLGWMHAAGLRPVAMDSHAGTLYGLTGPSHLDLALRFCARHGLGFRLPRELTSARAVVPAGTKDDVHADAVALADALGVPLPQTIGTCWSPGEHVASYAELQRTYLELVADLPEGVSEIFLHPAPESSVTGLDPAEGRKRVWERRMLRGPEFARVLDAEGIELVEAW